ncbi:CBO0543 family protein [Bacillus suaedaesalsae]|uniref:Histidine kinase N-terminal 7TM region domain-containing protein n=1 Tax=Bacillus suaedaesalsae TaxID=2810349 RepID=A0ABS2DK82_9BACI|nr:CBO0543 family protein [Bacillus suaedaesalsae]MBM6618811.1 hypothetical protein [Bacillus suaedaesalsae]
MHIIITLLLILLAFLKGNWRDWQKYSTTIMYVIICNLLYNVICQDYYLWRYEPDFLLHSHSLTDLLYSFFCLPAITLVYLTHYPNNTPFSKQFQYIVIWVIGSLIVEYPIYKFDRLLLLNGYEYWMEVIFYSLMYSMIRLHQSKPLLTYGLSVIIAVFMIWYFDVPIK